MVEVRPLPLSAQLAEYNRQAAESFGASSAELASWYDFADYATLARWVAEVTRPGSAVYQFEMAVEAIVAGDETALSELLRRNPELVRERSLRKHQATLLIYVGANGVEFYRQLTPPNAVRIAQLLLDAGSDIDAIGTMYGGTTTLGLVATSVHPVNTGIQEPLMDLLLERGARMDIAVAPNYRDGLVVSACLANGRPAAAEYLAARGAGLDLESAAGVGRLDVVRSYFTEDGALKGATAEQRAEALHWACGYGHEAVVDFLLHDGSDVNHVYMGATPLHYGAGGGHLTIVRQLLDRGATADAKDRHYDATPLEWALYGWTHPARDAKPGKYYDVVRLLAAAGSSIHPEWLQEESLRNDARMLEALGPLAA